MNKSEFQIDANGNKRWYLDGKLHREDGPAVEYANGDKWWCLDDKIHREDGPAIEWANGIKIWFINDKKVSELSGQPCDTQEQFEALMKVRAFW